MPATTLSFPTFAMIGGGWVGAGGHNPSGVNVIRLLDGQQRIGSRIVTKLFLLLCSGRSIFVIPWRQVEETTVPVQVIAACIVWPGQVSRSTKWSDDKKIQFCEGVWSYPSVCWQGCNCTVVDPRLRRRYFPITARYGDSTRSSRKVQWRISRSNGRSNPPLFPLTSLVSISISISTLQRYRHLPSTEYVHLKHLA